MKHPMTVAMVCSIVLEKLTPALKNSPPDAEVSGCALHEGGKIVVVGKPIPPDPKLAVSVPMTVIFAAAPLPIA